MHFFLSYAHGDDDDYLEKFLDDLGNELIQIGLRDTPQEVIYKDTKALRAGEVWPKALVDKINESRALICLYSILYFRSQYCGKEFSIYLKRENAALDSAGSAIGTKRIVPILWRKQELLDNEGLPPLIAKNIQFIVNKAPPIYKELGLQGILRKVGRKGPYYTIIETLAQTLKEISKAGPFPPHEAEIKSIQSAWEAAKKELMEASAAQRTQVTGPKSIAVFHANAIAAELDGTTMPTDVYAATRNGWIPFLQASPDCISDLVIRALAKMGLEYFEIVLPLQAGVPLNDQIDTALNEAQDRGSGAVVIVDGASYRHLPLWRQTIDALIAAGKSGCTIILIGQEAPPQAGVANSRIRHVTSREQLDLVLGELMTLHMRRSAETKEAVVPPGTVTSALPIVRP
jgi:hypothetical protein